MLLRYLDLSVTQEVLASHGQDKCIETMVACRVAFAEPGEKYPLELIDLSQVSAVRDSVVDSAQLWHTRSSLTC